MSAQDGIDTEALRTAIRAETLIKAHIDDCGETRREILAKFAEGKADRETQRTEILNAVKESVKAASEGRGKIYALLWAAVCGIIAVLVAIVAYFLIHVGIPVSR